MAIFLTGDELAALVERVFRPGPDDRALAILIDLPDERVPDNAAWLERRLMSAGWASELSALRGRLGLETHLCLYRNVGTNNGDLPEEAWLYQGSRLPSTVQDLNAGDAVPFSEILCSHSLLIAPTEFSATAPLKLLARNYRFRAATMPGFSRSMIPALKLDYGEINRRVNALKEMLDRAELAEFFFAREGGTEHCLVLDLRYRTAHASGGLLHEPGIAGNLPSGEAYIVPYEGEVPGQPSRSEGELPVQFGSEVVVYRIEQNIAREVAGDGPAAHRERERLREEPAYGNIAELGLGVLDEFGVQPCGSILLDEKLGLHIAFGRSDHFGGQVGPKQFSRPEAVVHIDRVYVPSTQPLIRVLRVDLDGTPLMENGRYVKKR
jgi:leucyl aminopeptidase (aminopeptidase T)